MRVHPIIRGFRVGVALPVLILSCAVAPLKAGQAPVVYSNVHYVADAGDLYGFELELTRHGEMTEGVIKYYQGSNRPDIDHLKGEASATKRLLLRGETKEGSVEVSGREKAGRFVGSVVYQVGRQSNRFELDLPLKKQRSE